MKRKIEGVFPPTPYLEMQVRVSDGSYESRFSIPVSASQTQIEQVAAMWVDALRKAVEITRPEPTK